MTSSTPNNITQLPPPAILQLTRLGERFRDGDRQAFAALYNTLRDAVYYAAQSILRCEADAEDVVQWTFIKAWEVRERLRSPESIKPWMIRIARNRARNLFKVRKRHQHDPDAIDALRDLDTNIDEALVRSSQRRYLYAQLDHLTPHQHKVVTLRIVHDMTFKQISDKLGCSCVSARVNYTYGVRRLKERMSA